MVDRNWIKLWVGPWLTGTTRFELDPAERAVWIDLLALAGESRYGGVIAAGQREDGSLEGYEEKYLALRLCHEPDHFSATLDKCVRMEKIDVTRTQINGKNKVTIAIKNWAKYQSEYLRQKPYRQAKAAKERRKLVVTMVTSTFVTKVIDGVVTFLSSPLFSSFLIFSEYLTQCKLSKIKRIKNDHYVYNVCKDIEEKGVRTRARHDKINNEGDDSDFIKHIIVACSDLRMARRGSSINEHDTRTRQLASDIHQHVRSQFRGKVLDTESELDYIRDLYAVFLSYTPPNPNRQDYIVDTNYSFAAFKGGMSEWIEQVERNRRSARMVSVKVPVPVTPENKAAANLSDEEKEQLVKGIVEDFLQAAECKDEEDEPKQSTGGE